MHRVLWEMDTVDDCTGVPVVGADIAHWPGTWMYDELNSLISSRVVIDTIVVMTVLYIRRSTGCMFTDARRFTLQTGRTDPSISRV